MRITKIDAAEANIIAAVRLHFGAGHPGPVLVLANSARETVAMIGQKIGADTNHAKIAAHLGITIQQAIAHLSKAAGFMKHGDRQMTEEFDLNERDVEVALYLASLDFGVVAGGLPVEAQVYEGWFLAKGVEKVSAMPLKRQHLIRNLIRQFPGIRSADAATQKKLGLDALKKAESDRSLKMTITRNVSEIINFRSKASCP
jgi:hypothetical protein